MVSKLSFTKLKDAVDMHAKAYETALIELENAANSSKGTNNQTLSIAQATMATTKVQIHQSLTEMASGIAKNATDHTKGLGRKISG